MIKFSTEIIEYHLIYFVIHDISTPLEYSKLELLDYKLFLKLS